MMHMFLSPVNNTGQTVSMKSDTAYSQTYNNTPFDLQKIFISKQPTEPRKQKTQYILDLDYKVGRSQVIWEVHNTMDIVLRLLDEYKDQDDLHQLLKTRILRILHNISNSSFFSPNDFNARDIAAELFFQECNRFKNLNTFKFRSLNNAEIIDAEFMSHKLVNILQRAFNLTDLEQKIFCFLISNKNTKSAHKIMFENYRIDYLIVLKKLLFQGDTILLSDNFLRRLESNNTQDKTMLNIISLIQWLRDMQEKNLDGFNIGYIEIENISRFIIANALNMPYTE